MGNDANNDKNRQPQQQQNNAEQQQPGQQHQQQGGQGAQQGGQPNPAGQQGGQRIDTDGDGRTRDPNDKSPTDNGGRR